MNNKIVYCIEAPSNDFFDEDCYDTLKEAQKAAEENYKDELDKVQIVERTEDDDYTISMWIYRDEEWIEK